MYAGYFGLSENPFSITPDPRFLFLSARHAEALAHLLFGITESGGFIQLTGEVGTGKTTLTRSLLEQLPTDVDVALILNPGLTIQEFMRTICQELGIDHANGASMKDMIDSLNQHLLRAHANGRRTALIIDEAQNLSTELLEQIRLLTNLETPKQKLLQIILIGQPELRDTLSRIDLRQLAQRITARYHLEPLNPTEISDYIRHRLRIAGAGGDIFTPAATKTVFRLTHGVPRLVNVICDRALLGAYSTEQRQVQPEIVRRAAKEVLGPDEKRQSIGWKIAAWFAGFGVIVALIWTLSRNPLSGTETPVARVTDPQPVTMVAVSQPEPPGELNLSDFDSSTDAAFATLFNIWNRVYEKSDTPACVQAIDVGLRCVYQRGTWNNLRQVNRPAIITLTDSQGTTHHALVATLDTQSATLKFGESEIEASLSIIDPLWYGEFLILWMPVVNIEGALSYGSQGEGVRWLRQQLIHLQEGETTTSVSDIYDSNLAQRVRRFQTENRLIVDGIAGEQTLLTLDALLPRDDTPTLVIQN
ncbi:MAG: AAA family ATPase [Gammaproteobacteria bacterium]